MAYSSPKKTVTYITITDSHDGQRIDNFLIGYWKGVPKSRIYRALRQGEIRVNGKRAKPNYRLQLKDQLRLPPIRLEEESVPLLKTPPKSQTQLIQKGILYEDEGLLILNKPSGIATHGGSGIHFGVIETLRFLRPRAKFLELAHRLDKETSGCLVIAKKRTILTELHELLREGQVEKIYLALLQGHLKKTREVDVPLMKYQLVSGERMVRVSENGKSAISRFQPLKHFSNTTLTKVILHTGRTHQIRVHATHIGHPIAGDEKYGDKVFNKQMKALGLKRLFLHAASLGFQFKSEQQIGICACLDDNLLYCLQQIEKMG